MIKTSRIYKKALAADLPPPTPSQSSMTPSGYTEQISEYDSEYAHRHRKRKEEAKGELDAGAIDANQSRAEDKGHPESQFSAKGKTLVDAILSVIKQLTTKYQANIVVPVAQYLAKQPKIRELAKQTNGVITLSITEEIAQRVLQILSESSKKKTAGNLESIIDRVFKAPRVITAVATNLYGWILPNGEYLPARRLHMETACEYLGIEYDPINCTKYNLMHQRGWIRVTRDGSSVDKITREKLHRLQMTLMNHNNTGTNEVYYIDQYTGGFILTTLADLLVANDVSDLTRAKVYT